MKKKFRREWILVAVDKFDQKTTTPISGQLLYHSPHREEIYSKLFSLKNRRNILVEYTEDRLPYGHAAAF